jgi:TolB-like protein
MKIVLAFLLLLPALLFAEMQTIAVLEFEGEGISKSELAVLTNKMSSEMVSLEAYTVLERSQMGAILEEQGFQQTGCISSECAVEVGQLLGVTHMVSGNVGIVDDILYVNIRLIDVTTSKILKNIDRYVSGGLKNVLMEALPEIAAEISGKKVDNGTAMVGAKKSKIVITPSVVISPVNTKDESSSVTAFAFGGEVGLLLEKYYHGLSFHFKAPSIAENDLEDDDMEHDDVTDISTALMGGYYTFIREWNLKDIVRVGGGLSVGFRRASKNGKRPSDVEYMISEDNYGIALEEYVDKFLSFGGPLIELNLGYKQV